MLFKIKQTKQKSDKKMKEKYGFKQVIVMRYFTEKPMHKSSTREKLWRGAQR